MKILYRTINLYFQQNQNFYTTRNFTIQAATDLYGLCSQEVKQVTNAWEAVGVLGGTYNISPCVNFIGFIKKGICSSSVVTYKVNSNLDGNVFYTWSSILFGFPLPFIFIQNEKSNPYYRVILYVLCKLFCSICL